MATERCCQKLTQFKKTKKEKKPELEFCVLDFHLESCARTGVKGTGVKGTGVHAQV